MDNRNGNINKAQLLSCLKQVRDQLHDQAPLPGEGEDVEGGLEFYLIELLPLLLRQQVHGEKAHVVAGVLILGPGISQAHHQPVHGGGFGA